MILRDIRYKVEQYKGRRAQVLHDLEDAQEKAKQYKRSIRQHEQAKTILRDVGLKTQQQLQYHISGIVSLALDAVLQDDPYEFKVEFIQRRNKTECDLYFERDGNRVDPLMAAGGGAVDVASFALRIASWSMQRPRTRAVIVMDEPFRFLSNNYQEKASAMLKDLSEKLGIQFIIVTHEDILTEYADKVFTVVNRNGKAMI
ncbi:MAG: hypothetical protein PHG64_12510 [Paludibacter sp.]|nr:hypothetical protein [Paludibacter sp.]